MPMLVHSLPFACEVHGRTGVEPGVPTSFTTEEAGWPPDPRRAIAMKELAAAMTAHDHPLAAKLRDEIAQLEIGEGLLAQDTWTVAPKKRGASPDDTTDPLEGDS